MFMNSCLFTPHLPIDLDLKWLITVHNIPFNFIWSIKTPGGEVFDFGFNVHQYFIYNSSKILALIRLLLFSAFIQTKTRCLLYIQYNCIMYGDVYLWNAPFLRIRDKDSNSQFLYTSSMERTIWYQCWVCFWIT